MKHFLLLSSNHIYILLEQFTSKRTFYLSFNCGIKEKYLCISEYEIILFCLQSFELNLLW